MQAPTRPVSTDQSSADGQPRAATTVGRSRQPTQLHLQPTHTQRDVAENQHQQPTEYEHAPAGRNLRAKRPRHQPVSPDQQLLRAARRRPAAPRAGKRKLEPEAAELSEGETLPVRKVPASMRQTAVATGQALPGIGSASQASQAAAARRRAQSQADVETIVCVSTTADVGDLLNGATPGKRKSRRKP